MHPKSVLTPALCLLVAVTAEARTPAVPQQTLTAAPPAVYTLSNVNVQVDARTLLRGSSLTIRNGRIEAVGKPAPADAWVIDLGGKTVLPAFVDPAGNYGIQSGTPCRPAAAPPAGGGMGGRRGGMGGGAAPATPSGPPAHWNPRVCPERSLAREFSVDGDRAKALRAQGFAVVHTLPDFGNLGGQSVMLALPPSNQPADALLRADVSQHVSLAPAFGFGGVYPGSTMGALALLRQSLYDARWYAAAGAKQLPEASPALEALGGVLAGRQPLVLIADDELDAARIAAVGREFKVRTIVVGTGTEYRKVDALQGMDLVLPLNFPKAPAVNDPAKALEVNLVDLEHWRYAPFNPKLLADAGVRFSLTSRGLEKPEDFLPRVRTAVRHGLSPQTALAALTEVPAAQFGLAGEIGVLKAGARANLLITDANFLGDEKAKLYEVWVEGEREVLSRIDAPEWRGEWTLAFDGGSAPALLKLTGEAAKPKATLDETEVKATLDGARLLIDAPATLFGAAEGSSARTQLELIHAGQSLQGRQVASTGDSRRFTAALATPHAETAEEAKPPKPIPALPERFAYPAGEYGRTAPPAQPKQLLFRGATVWLADREQPLADTDVLVEAGKIKAVGANLSAGTGAEIIDARGKHLTPGLIDAHSHIAIDGNVNEPSHTITSEVRIGDVLNPADVSIYRQLAGGVTTAHLLHGSANAIGGQSQVIKLRWGSDAEGLKFAEAAPTIKFALGENPKQSNWGNEFTSRYPQTRMGVEQIIEDAFTQARAYQARLKADPDGTRRDLRYDALVEILEGKRQVHTHSYRADEILAFARLSQRFGFRIAAFQHVLEGYKVARELAEVGAGASTFADWWAFKLEVYDAIPYNASMMAKRGVLTSINSDSPDLARRLNTEAAKAVRFGGLTESQALALVTINPATQLKVDALVGSIEAGKQADLVLWTTHPLSTAARVEQTWIEGRKYFDQAEDAALQARVDAARGELIAAALDAAGDGGPGGSGPRPGMGRPGVARLYDQVLGQRQWPVELAIRRGPYHNGEPVHICLGQH